MKRFFDIFISFNAIIFLIPLFIFTAILIKLTSEGPVLFKQIRSGKNRQPFVIYKFRTMYISTPENIPTSQLESATSHITKIGKILRKTSIDELPQLFNILKGNMSIVGPRPLLCNELEVLEGRELHHANSVRPGLTGLAQINGRDEISIDDKVKYDSEYVKKCSIFFDFKIIIRTCFYVLGAKGVKEGK